MESIKVIVVDDEAEFVHTLVERLKLRGFQVHGFVSGREAMKNLEVLDFDIALLDVRMPELGGLEIIEKIKRRWPRRQVILLTGHGSAEDAKRGLDLGACHYLMKPIRIEQLIECLHQAHETRQSP